MYFFSFGRSTARLNYCDTFYRRNRYPFKRTFTVLRAHGNESYVIVLLDNIYLLVIYCALIFYSARIVVVSAQSSTKRCQIQQVLTILGYTSNVSLIWVLSFQLSKFLITLPRIAPLRWLPFGTFFAAHSFARPARLAYSCYSYEFPELYPVRPQMSAVQQKTLFRLVKLESQKVPFPRKKQEKSDFLPAENTFFVAEYTWYLSLALYGPHAVHRQSFVSHSLFGIISRSTVT